jgi:hypothetical protein
MTAPELRPTEDRDRFAQFLRTLEEIQFTENVGQSPATNGAMRHASMPIRHGGSFWKTANT